MKNSSALKTKFAWSCVLGLVFAFIPVALSGLATLEEVDATYRFYNINSEILDNGDLVMNEEYSFEDSSHRAQERYLNASKNNAGISSNYSYLADDMEITVSNSTHSYTRTQNDSKPEEDPTSGLMIAFEGERNELEERISDDTYLVYVPDGLSNRVVINVTYTIKNAVTRYNDYSELNWKFLQELGTIKKSVSLTLIYPENEYGFYDYAEEETNPRQEKIYYSGYGGSNSSFGDFAGSNNILTASSSELGTDEELEIYTYFPTSMQSNIASSNPNYVNQNGIDAIINRLDAAQKTNEQIYHYNQLIRTARLITSIALPIVSILIMIVIALLWKKVYHKFDKEYETTFTGELYRELPANYPPAIMGYLYHEEKIGQDDLSATLMDLIYKGFIKVDTNGAVSTDKKPNYKYVFDRQKDQSGLMGHEKYLLYWYFTVLSEGADELALNDIDQKLKSEANALKYNECMKQWNKTLLNDASQFHFYEKAAETGAKKYTSVMIIGIILIIFNTYLYTTLGYMWWLLFFVAASLISIFAFSFYTMQVKRRTKAANEDYVKWQAFEKFLREFSSLQDYAVISISIWDEYLVYATALGIADLVEKQLRTKYSSLQDSGEQSLFFYDSYFYGSYFRYRMYQASRVSTSTIHAAQARRAASSGGRRGGGGGFGGGTSFGGGGSHSSFR